MTQTINEKNIKISRKIELLNLEYNNEIKEFKNGVSLFTIDEILKDYFHEMKLIEKEYEYNEEY